MKFFAIFAAVLGVAIALPSPSVWTLEQLSAALEDPHIDHNMIPYLENALNKLIASIFAGSNVNAILVEFPEVAVKPTPVIPEYVPTPSASSGPLVQLIVNINNRNEVVGAPVAPEIIPTPVQIAESPEYEEIAVGPAIIENPEVISNPVDIMNPIVVSPVVDGDLGILV